MRKKSVLDNIHETNKLMHKNTKTAERLAGIAEEVVTTWEWDLLQKRLFIILL